MQKDNIFSVHLGGGKKQNMYSFESFWRDEQ